MITLAVWQLGLLLGVTAFFSMLLGGIVSLSAVVKTTDYIRAKR